MEEHQPIDVHSGLEAICMMQQHDCSCMLAARDLQNEDGDIPVRTTELRICSRLMF